MRWYWWLLLYLVGSCLTGYLVGRVIGQLKRQGDVILASALLWPLMLPFFVLVLRAKQRNG